MERVVLRLTRGVFSEQRGESTQEHFPGSLAHGLARRFASMGGAVRTAAQVASANAGQGRQIAGGIGFYLASMAAWALLTKSFRW
jgi:hypothetical protein